MSQKNIWRLLNTDMSNEIQGKSILILGKGREGKSARDYLEKNFSNLTIVMLDEYDSPTYLDNLDTYDTIIRSPGISPYKIHTTAHVTTATNIFFSLVIGKTIGVTGTKGKSTTASLIAHLLSAYYTDVRLAGNIGKPMLDVLDKQSKDTIFVLELSSHQLVDIHYSPHIAVLLEVVPEHLDYYPDFATYKRAKENIYRFQKKDDILVQNEHVDASYATPLLGNQKNIAAAIRVAQLLHVPDGIINRQLATFQSLPHRLERVGMYNGITFYNDSLATIPEATMHALQSIPNVETLIAGGYDRNLMFTKLSTYLNTHPVKNLIVFPDTGKKIAQGIINKNITMFHVTTMKEAIEFAYMHTPRGTICLLSPASASYNIFKDYADRGQQFRYWVETLGKKR